MSILLFLVEMTGFEPVSRITLCKTFFRLRKTVLSDIWKQFPGSPYVVNYLFSLELIIIGSKTATLTWQEQHYCGIHTALCLKTRQLFCYLHLSFFGFWGDPNLPAYLTSLYPVKTKTFPFDQFLLLWIFHFLLLYSNLPPVKNRFVLSSKQALYYPWQSRGGFFLTKSFLQYIILNTVKYNYMINYTIERRKCQWKV